MNLRLCLILATGFLLASTTNAAQVSAPEKQEAKQETTMKDSPQLWCVYSAGKGPGTGKHIVLIAGDDEYRSEEALPMLGKILAVRHGFKCTVLFPIDPDTNLIKPNHQTNIPGMEAIDSADLLILGLRFRNLPDKQMKHFVDYVDSGKPIIGLRTSTHAFNNGENKDSSYRDYGFRSKNWPGGFGQQVLGDTWISHHGDHNVQSTRGVVKKENAKHPILKGVTDVWGPTDVYGIKNLPKTATVLMDGAVLTGMKPTDKPVEDSDNNPMMPLAWIKDYKSKSGKTARIFTTTMGSSTDFQSEHLRRMVINASYWAVGLEKKIPAAANVKYVGEYKPTKFGFGSFQKNLKPSDFNLKKGTIQPATGKVDQDAAIQSMVAHARKSLEAFDAKDPRKILDTMHSRGIKKLGGESNAMNILENAMETLDQQIGDQKIEVKLGEPGEFLVTEKFVFAYVNKTTVLTAPDPSDNVVVEGYLFGISEDQGKTWTFIDSGGGARGIRNLFPELPESFSLPDE